MVSPKVEFTLDKIRTCAFIIFKPRRCLCSSSLHSVVILRFDQAEYRFIEGETIELVVTKSAPLDSELTFIVSRDELTVDGTFEAGVNAGNNVTISIESPDDEIALEPDEVFTITLSLLEPNAQIMIPRPFANVTIIDNDGE